MSEEQPKDDPLKGRKILVVDDDDEIRGVYEISLRNAGFEVSSAMDGNRALSMLESFSPDLVILDLMMPRCSGFDVLLRLQEGRQTVPVVVVTGRYTDGPSADRLRGEANVADFLEKPVNPGDLLKVVRRVLSGK